MALSPENTRPLFPVAQHHVYLNNAGVAPTSTRFVQAMDRFNEDLLHHGLHGEAGWEAESEAVRAGCARIIGATPGEIAFVRNTSHGLGLIAEGIDWKPGDEVAVCTSLEYPSNVYVWEHVANRGVGIVPIEPVKDGVTVEGVERALTPRTRLVAVSAVQYATGFRADLEAIGALCRDRGVLLSVDGIQQVGAHPLDVKACGIHFLSADSHKWMLGQPGIGFMYVDRDILDSIRPSIVGWKSTTDAWNFDRAHFELKSDAQKFEEGSPPYALLYGFRAAVDLLLEVGISSIREHIDGLHGRVTAGLTNTPYAVTPDPESRAGILMLEPREGDPAAIAERCGAASIVVSVRRGRIRISPHMYNTAAEMDRLLEVLAS